MKRATLIILLSFIFSSAFAAEGASLKQFNGSTRVLGATPVEVTVVGYPSEGTQIQKAIDKALGEIQRYSKLFDTDDPESDILKINTNAGKSAVMVDNATYDLLATAVNVSKWTYGAFDVTYPSTSGDYRHIRFDKKDKSILLRKPEMSISVRQIAKGYIADTIVRLIHSYDFHNVMVDVGGIMHATGKDIYGPWQVQVQDPEGGKARRGLNLSGTNLSVASANSSQQIIDGRTKSLAMTCRQVTILARDAATAIAFAEGIYALGPKKGYEVLEYIPNIKGVIFTPDGDIIKSKGL